MFLWCSVLVLFALQVHRSCGSLGDPQPAVPECRTPIGSSPRFFQSLHFFTEKNFLIKSQKFYNTLLAQRPTTTVFLTLFLCGDIEVNPGPAKLNIASTYPCGVCENHVGWSPVKGVQCEHPECGVWYHTLCISMPTSEYEALGDKSWFCYKCDSHNVSSFSYHAYNISTRNHYSPLFSVSNNMDHPVNCSISPLSSIRMPKIDLAKTMPDISPIAGVSPDVQNSPLTRKSCKHSSPLIQTSESSPNSSTPDPHILLDPSRNLMDSMPSNPISGVNQPPRETHINNLRVAVVNCNSARNKKAEFTNLVLMTEA